MAAGGVGPDEMLPSDRKAWYQSENERIKLEKALRLLVPVEEAHREMSQLAKASGLDSLADMLERDAGLPPEAIELVEQTTDALREQMYQAIIAAVAVAADDEGRRNVGSIASAAAILGSIGAKIKQAL